MTENQNKLKKKYEEDAELMASKSRFGYFSILPSHTAAVTDYAQKKAQKDSNGKVKTQPRGFFSGSKSAKVLSKTTFSQIVSPFVGCPFVDPDKPQRQRLMKEKKKWAKYEVFKPARLQKTIISSSYEYKCLPPEDKTKKYRDKDGKVITQPLNISSNPLSKVDYEMQKKFKYTEDPYDNLKKQRKLQLDEDLAKRGEAFKAGNPVKEYFSNNKELFDDTSKGKEQKPQHFKRSDQKKSYLKHEFNFRPSSGRFTKYNGLFNQITYKQEGSLKKRPKTAGKLSVKQEIYKSMNKVKDSKPCPSISTSKMNLMRSFR